MHGGSNACMLIFLQMRAVQAEENAEVARAERDEQRALREAADAELNKERALREESDKELEVARAEQDAERARWDAEKAASCAEAKGVHNVLRIKDALLEAARVENETIRDKLHTEQDMREAEGTAARKELEAVHARAMREVEKRVTAESLLQYAREREERLAAEKEQLERELERLRASVGFRISNGPPM